jgi:hypothetical protein
MTPATRRHPRWPGCGSTPQYDVHPKIVRRPSSALSLGSYYAVAVGPDASPRPSFGQSPSSIPVDTVSGLQRVLEHRLLRRPRIRTGHGRAVCRTSPFAYATCPCGRPTAIAHRNLTLVNEFTEGVLPLGRPHAQTHGPSKTAFAILMSRPTCAPRRK